MSIGRARVMTGNTLLQIAGALCFFATVTIGATSNAAAAEIINLKLTGTEETLSFELPSGWAMVGQLTESPGGSTDIRLYHQTTIPEGEHLESFATDFNPRLRATGQQAIDGLVRAAAITHAYRLKDCKNPAPHKPLLLPLNGYPSIVSLGACPLTSSEPPYSTPFVKRYIQSPHGVYTLMWSSKRPIGVDGKPTRTPPQGFDYATEFFGSKVWLCDSDRNGSHPCKD